MSWLAIASIAYFLNAVAILVDKFLLKKKIGDPIVYTFYVSVLSLLALVFLPFAFTKPSTYALSLAFFSGLSFTAALFFLFKALSRADVSQIGPLVGGISPLFVLSLAVWFLGEHLTRAELVGVFFLVLGTLALFLAGHSAFKINAVPVFLAAFFFALHYVSLKELYQQINFLSGLVFSRLGTAAGGLALLLRPAYYQRITEDWRRLRPQAGGLFVIGQSAGALSAVLINYAILLGSVSLVNALQGLQYIFLLILTLIFHRFAPRILEEDLAGRALFFKLVAIILISVGLSYII
jgi:drug/metabolite transporter (DMT)-like permease